MLLGGCAASDRETTGLDAAAVGEIDETSELIAVIAAEGVRQDGANAAAVRVARDAVTFAEVVFQEAEQGREFLTAVLDADADTLPILVAAGVDSLVGGVDSSVHGINSLVPEAAADEAVQRNILQQGPGRSQSLFRAMQIAARTASVDNDDRWATLLGVLETARLTGVTRGSFVAALDDTQLEQLASVSEPPDVPEDDAAFVAATADSLVELLVDTVYADPEVREILTGNRDIDRGEFIDDPFIASLFEFDRDGLGRSSIRAVAALLEAP